MDEILIFKADERQEHLCTALKKAGYEAKLYDDDDDKLSLQKCFAVILPLPSVKNGKINFSQTDTESFVDSLGSNTVVFSGCTANTEFEKKLFEKGIKNYDYYKREELVISNAYATAQGVLKYILNSMKTMCADNRIIISGFGKTGKAICETLGKNGFDITVLVRNGKYLPQVKLKGAKGCLYGEFEGGYYDYLINTVPAKVIDDSILKKLNKDCNILEIASEPYGTDFISAEKYGFNVKILPSIPGKDVPRSAGEYTAFTVDNIIKEDNLWKK